MKVALALVALSLPVTSGFAQAVEETVHWEVLPDAMMHLTPNGRYCTVDLTMKNNLAAALEVSGDAILVDAENTTLAQRYVSFPSAMPNGKSKTDALFTNGVCPQVSTVYLNITQCRFTGTATGLKDQYCKKRYTFSFKMQ